MTCPLVAAAAERPTATIDARRRRVRAAFARSLAPALLPALGHVCAQAQVEAALPAPTGIAVASPGVTGTADTSLPAGGGSTSGPAGPGLFATSAGRTFRVAYRAAVSETLTDNVRLSSTDRQAAAITQASAGVQLVSTAGRLRGFADYSLVANHYAGDAAATRLFSLLAASLTGELVERRAYVDVSASISQQMLSSFGTQSNDLALVNDNRAEVRTYRVSPYLRGVLGRLATYELRASHSATHIEGSTAGDISANSVSALLNGTRLGRFNWSAAAVHQVVGDGSSRDRTSDAANATLHYTPWPDLRLSVFGGIESNDYLTTEKISRGVYGGRVAWTPTPRTSFVAERRESFFGESHVLTLAHRLRRSSFVLSDVKGVFVSGLQSDGSLGTTLREFYNLQFARIEPDPARRAIEVARFFDANRGLINPDAALPAGVLTSATSLQRSQILSYTWFGLRSAASLYAARTSTQRLENRPLFLAGDLATFARVRQQTVGMTLSHRLTPVSLLSAGVSQQRSFGDAPTGVDLTTRLRTASISWSTRLNPWVSTAVTARHNRFESSTRSFHESAVIGTLNLRF